MKDCWAKVLGDCVEDISREHLVSRSVFLNETVTVQGLKWCKDNPKEIGLSALTSKILCRKHNSDLSELDAAAKKSLDAIRKADELFVTRKKIPKVKHWTHAKFSAPGYLFERWFLKTLINLTYDGDLPIGADSKIPGLPSESLVRIVFGFEKFPGKSGLYSVVKVGEQTAFHEKVEYSPLIYRNSFVAGALFTLKGLRFLFFLGEEGPPNPPTNLGIREDWGDSQLNFHNREIRFEVNGGFSHKVSFLW